MVNPFAHSVPVHVELAGDVAVASPVVVQGNDGPSLQRGQPTVLGVRLIKQRGGNLNSSKENVHSSLLYPLQVCARGESERVCVYACEGEAARSDSQKKKGIEIKSQNDTEVAAGYISNGLSNKKSYQFNYLIMIKV